MKRIIITIFISVIVAMCSYAQDLSFKGISPDAPTDSIVSHLISNGFTVKKEANDCYTLEGSFWKFNHCEVLVMKENGPINVHIPTWIKMGEIEDLVGALTAKYGVPQKSSNSLGDEYFWLVGENGIAFNYLPRIDAIILSYLPKKYAALEVSKQRKYNSDL